MPVGWQAVIVATIAATVGLGELLSRYRSDPKHVLSHPLAWVYIAINAGAGVGALFLIRALDWKFGQTDNIDLYRILIAGFGTLAFFRTSFFIAKVGGSDVGIGPSLVLGSLLDACDRAVDRKSAVKMAGIVNDEELAGLVPASVMATLPVLCLALMQNLPESDQAQLAADISKVRNETTITSRAQMRAVIIQITKRLGEAVVREVLANARSIFIEPPPAPAPPSAPAEPPLREAVLDKAGELSASAAEGPSPSEPPPSQTGPSPAR